MPIPFTLLCHSRGGGLPRDVIRVAREILPDDDRPHRLAAVCRQLVASQVAAKVGATLVAARRLPYDAEIDAFRGWLEALRKLRTDSGSLTGSAALPIPPARGVGFVAVSQRLKRRGHRPAARAAGLQLLQRDDPRVLRG
jgi:hypothetical protein